MSEEKEDFWIFDSTGVLTPVDSNTYWEWHKTFPTKRRSTRGIRVAITIKDDIMISTVFLGKAHDYADEAPVLFETLVLEGEYYNYYRYLSLEDALMGHYAVCEEKEIFDAVHSTCEQCPAISDR